MRPGPPPKPTALKELEGNPGHQKKNRREPRPASKLPRCPSHLSPAARKLWNRIGPKFAGMGVMAEVDELAFALLCESYAAWTELVEAARKDGPVVKVNGQPVPNPLLVRADREAEKFRRMLAEFGGTPSARSRIAAEGGDQPDDDLAAFLSQPLQPRMRIAK